MRFVYCQWSPWIWKLCRWYHSFCLWEHFDEILDELEKHMTEISEWFLKSTRWQRNKHWKFYHKIKSCRGSFGSYNFFCVLLGVAISISLDIVFSRTMEFARYAISSMYRSEDAFNISVTTPGGPDALPLCILQIDFTIISIVIRRGGPSSGLTVDRSSTHQGNSTFSKLLQCYFRVFFLPSSLNARTLLSSRINISPNTFLASFVLLYNRWYLYQFQHLSAFLFHVFYFLQTPFV